MRTPSEYGILGKMDVTHKVGRPIAGLMYLADFISEAEQDELIHLIDSQPFSTAIHRRQQFYGEVSHLHDVSTDTVANDRTIAILSHDALLAVHSAYE